MHHRLHNSHNALEKSMNTILVLVLPLFLIGALPAWPYSAGWGYYPSGGVGLAALTVIVLLVSGRL